MTDTGKKEYEELKSLLYTGQISQYGKRKLIEIIEKQDTEINKLNNVIDRMADTIDSTYFEREEFEKWFENKILPKDEFGLPDYKERYIRQPIIKEYFMKEDK